MFIQYEFENIDEDQDLKDTIATKLSKLSHSYPFMSKVEVVLQENKSGNDTDKVCRIKTQVGDREIKAKATKASFTEAIPNCIASFRAELEDLN